MNTQRQHVLELLKDAGMIGVNSYELTYRYGIKQAPTRIKELRDEGYSIISKPLPNRSVQYILNAEPSNNVTEPKAEIPPWMKQYEKYEKDGKTYWREV